MVAANSSQPYSLLFLLTGHLKNFLILGQNRGIGVISRDETKDDFYLTICTFKRITRQEYHIHCELYKLFYF